MDQIVIRGGRRLQGRIQISGAKNAALTLMPCALLTDEPLTLRNLPRLADIDSFGHLLNNHGLSTTIEGTSPDEFGRVMTVRANRITSTVAPYDIVRKMRASILVLGPLLARAGTATVSLPGGCAIGNRPIDLHLKALEHLGAEIELAAGYVKATAPKGGLPGGRYVFPIVSVGATENAVMAAVLAKGVSILENVAREPEIVDLCQCLVAMGAKIAGVGTEKLTITGVKELHGATYAVMPDRIEAGSYACAAAITGGEIELVGASAHDLGVTIEALHEAGVDTEETPDGIIVRRTGEMRGINISTAPYPGFATDMQAQFMAMLTVAGGASLLTETIFENRFMHVPELSRMGADITVRGRSAVVRGVPRLTGAPVMATDLRASMSLVLAGLAAQGETTVARVYHLDRGYERLEEKLQAVGADIERIGDGESRLALLGHEPGDIETFSALLQDATLRLADVAFDRMARRLVCLVNRYRREAATASRIRCALRVETVEAVQRAGWSSDPEAVTVILSLAQDGDWLVITCAAGIALRARIEVVDLVLEDIGAPWATTRVPDHD